MMLEDLEYEFDHAQSVSAAGYDLAASATKC